MLGNVLGLVSYVNRITKCQGQKQHMRAEERFLFCFCFFCSQHIHNKNRKDEKRESVCLNLKILCFFSIAHLVCNLSVHERASFDSFSRCLCLCLCLSLTLTLCLSLTVSLSFSLSLPTAHCPHASRFLCVAHCKGCSHSAVSHVAVINMLIFLISHLETAACLLLLLLFLPSSAPTCKHK